jgi:hypothetical protein
MLHISKVINKKAQNIQKNQSDRLIKKVDSVGPKEFNCKKSINRHEFQQTVALLEISCCQLLTRN